MLTCWNRQMPRWLEILLYNLITQVSIFIVVVVDDVSNIFTSVVLVTCGDGCCELVIKHIIIFDTIGWQIQVESIIVINILWVCGYCIDGLVQDCSNSSTNTFELLQSCTKPKVLQSEESPEFIYLQSLLYVEEP